MPPAKKSLAELPDALLTKGLTPSAVDSPPYMIWASQSAARHPIMAGSRMAFCALRGLGDRPESRPVALGAGLRSDFHYDPTPAVAAENLNRRRLRLPAPPAPAPRGPAENCKADQSAGCRNTILPHPPTAARRVPAGRRILVPGQVADDASNPVLDIRCDPTERGPCCARPRDQSGRAVMVLINPLLLRMWEKYGPDAMALCRDAPN